MIFLGKIKYPITLWIIIKQSIWISYFTRDGDWFSVIIVGEYKHLLDSPPLKLLSLKGY